MDVCATEHLNAQDNGGQGGIGGAAEQTNQSQRGSQAGVQPQQTAAHAAEGGADAEGGNNLATLEAGGKGDGGEEHLDGEGIPVGVTGHRGEGHIHAGSVEPVVAGEEGHSRNEDTAGKDADPGTPDMVGSQMFGFVEHIAHGDAKQRQQNCQQGEAPDIAKGQNCGGLQQISFRVDTQSGGHPAGSKSRQIAGKQRRGENGTHGLEFHGEQTGGQGSAEQTGKQAVLPPSCSAAPSRPAEPPKRWEMAVARKITGAIRGFSSSPSRTASMISLVPRFFFSRNSR